MPPTAVENNNNMNNPTDGAKETSGEAQQTTPSEPVAVDEAVENVVQQIVLEASAETPVEESLAQHQHEAVVPAQPKKKRLCRYPGCTKVIKSQGHCQRHGAKAKRCKVEGCEKQAQGTHEGMCKRHWKQVHFPPPPPKPEEVPPPPQGESVYDVIIPASISYRPATTGTATVSSSTADGGGGGAQQQQQPGSNAGTMTTPSRNANNGSNNMEDTASQDGTSGAAVATTTANVAAAALGGEAPTLVDGPAMPLVAFLKDGQETKDAGWHRNHERRARGMFPVASLSSQLEPWERQLALVEILLLSGGTPHANFKDLAHAWGREKGFHQLLVQAVCERRGEVERKKRSDAGKTMSTAEREVFRAKLKKARLSGGGGHKDEGGEDGDEHHQHHAPSEHENEILVGEAAGGDTAAVNDAHATNPMVVDTPAATLNHPGENLKKEDDLTNDNTTGVEEMVDAATAIDDSVGAPVSV